MKRKAIISILLIIFILSSGLCFSACGNIDYNSSSTFINEETSAIDNEYVFKVIELNESTTYNVNGIAYDSQYDNGIFLLIKLLIHRKTIENAVNREINSSWFKLKRGSGFTIWQTSLGETIEANKHIDALASSVEPFEMYQNGDREIEIVFEIAENYLHTERVLVLEIDRPWSSAGAKEIVLINRPDNI